VCKTFVMTAEASDEKFDPSVEIWEGVKKRQQQAASARQETNSKQVGDVRKRAELEETKAAKDTWGEAEAALKQVLRRNAALLHVTSGEDRSLRDNGLRKHGESVKHRKVRDFDSQQASQASPPLQRSPGKAGERGLDESRSDWEDMEASASGSPTGYSPLRTTSRLECFDKRGEANSRKASAAAMNKAEGAKKRLRAKIATVMIEVKKRQELHQLQAKSKKFREKRYASGRGPTASLGDTTEFALGLTCLAESGTDQAMTSPRRTAILESLTLEELTVLRLAPTFFFTGNHIANAVPEERGHSVMNDRSRSLGSLPSASGGSPSAGSKAPKGLWPGSADATVFEDLIEFFSVSAADKLLDISVYSRRLRGQLLASAGSHNQLRSGGVMSEVDWRAKLCRYREPDENPPAEPPPPPEIPKGPLEMMPSLGRHPPIRADQASPTLSKVREVYQRRDELDAKFVEDRAEGISRRLALNSFKAREQQRELSLQDFQTKELHKVRMLQAEEKKAMLDAELVQNTELMSIQKIHRIMLANERSERAKEEKREGVQQSLDNWKEGLERCDHMLKKSEWEKRKDGERNQAKYMQRLTTIAQSKVESKQSRNHGQKNDDLKSSIQSSLCSQLKEQQVQNSLDRADVFNDKQNAAAIRRQCHMLGNRYCFVEKAFGANAIGFDAKSHSVAVDRRSKSWVRNSEEWGKSKGTFSAPNLPTARPLSPGGTLDESTFKAIGDLGFKTETSAVALA